MSRISTVKCPTRLNVNHSNEKTERVVYNKTKTHILANISNSKCIIHSEMAIKLKKNLFLFAFSSFVILTRFNSQTETRDKTLCPQ